MRTVGWRIIWQKIIAVIDATFAVAKRKPEMNFFRLSFRNCKSCVYNCDNPLSSLSYKYSAFYKHLVHIKPLIQVLLKTWRTEFCRKLLSPSRFFCFHFITYKKTYPVEKNVPLTLMMRQADDYYVAFQKKNTRVWWYIFMFLKTVKLICVFPLSIIVDAVSCCDGNSSILKVCMWYFVSRKVLSRLKSAFRMTSDYC